MTTNVQLKRWGNSQGIRIPKDVLNFLDLTSDTEFTLYFDADEKTITLKVSDQLTPYQRLIKKNHKKERIPFMWDQIDDDEELI